MYFLSQLWKFSRPHTIIGTTLSVLALCAIAIATTHHQISEISIAQLIGTWIACLCGNIYIVGDDSSFLYVLKYDLTVLAEVPLYQAKAEDLTGNRILKKKKADLECITKLTING